MMNAPNVTIIQFILKDYDGGEFGREVERTSNFIEKTLSREEDACIVCYETIERKDPIWSCPSCYSHYHLLCIAKWMKQNICAQQRKVVEDAEQYSILLNSLEDEALVQERLDEIAWSSNTLKWSCPTCREEFPSSLKPERYFCYCGKVQDPPDDVWMLPHSCGQHCNRKLKGCEHKCTVLCHPGPCPPCPRQLNDVACHCGRGDRRTVRCHQRLWACSAICNALLQCGEHRCSQICHPSPCAPCKRVGMRKCACGKCKKMLACDAETWHCEDICGRPLSCGNHTCSRICHLGACGSCPLLAERHCPCGKKKYPGLTSCHEIIDQKRVSTTDEPGNQLIGPPCDDTCERLLACGLHQCEDSCHRGPCGQCKATIIRKCRCGSTKQKVQCYRGEITCQTKCTRMRDCGRHPCRRKCCSGRGDGCATCDQVCNRPLACGQHRCKARCHAGPCYPCREVMTLTCPCGQTQRQVPCGLARKAARLVSISKKGGANNSPRDPSTSELSLLDGNKGGVSGITVTCHKNCPKPSRCRHANQHGCHDRKQDCPPCQILCHSLLPCGHKCLSTCHESVPRIIRLDKSKLPGPWAAKDDGKVEWVSQPCPPCRFPVTIRCRGLHGDLQVACCEVRETSCGQPCGRLLNCTNHTCDLECHAVEPTCTSKDMDSTFCQLCTRYCEKPRPMHCSHECSLIGCHPAECPPCTRLVPRECHCGRLQIQLDCVDYQILMIQGQSALDARLSCPAECEQPLKNCKHNCKRTCHSGDCETSEEVTVCSAKITVKCACAKRKFRFICGRVRFGFQPMPPGFLGLNERPQMICDFENGCVKKKHNGHDAPVKEEETVPKSFEGLTLRPQKKHPKSASRGSKKASTGTAKMAEVESKTDVSIEESTKVEESENIRRKKKSKWRQMNIMKLFVSFIVWFNAFTRNYRTPILLVIFAIFSVMIAIGDGQKKGIFSM